MKNLFPLLLLFVITKTNAQYYYQDLIGSSEIMQQMKVYLANKIQKVSSTGYTPNGAASSDYSETQEINQGFQQLRITTLVDKQITRLTYKFNEQGILQSLADSSAGIKSVSIYTYDKAGKLIEITNTMTDSLQDFTQTETHLWIYNNNKPEKMWRIINKTDSLEARFKTDENGNITEEQNFKKGKGADPVYYYYDNKNRLTDIVRYNAKAKRLLPDYMFEYDDSNRVIQKITTISNQNLGYLTWRYLYNETGLKTKEALFNKEKQLQGRIDYSYTSY